MEQTETPQINDQTTEESMSFEDLGLDEQTLKAVEKKGFTQPSPIQILAIPRLLEGDANLIAKARTGTGKTAAFGLPLVQKIREDKGHPQALILAPTRELAMQVCREIESLSTNNFPRLTAVYGGASMGIQLKDLRRGVEIVVGTPGRVKDHLERGTLRLENISYFILDEADEMLDMGFIDDIESIFEQANPQSRILLFSATMPPEILKIAGKFMGDYEILEEETKPEEPLLTEQHYWIVKEYEKIEALVRLIDISPDFYGLVFTMTKNDADMVAKQLDERGYDAVALHGDIAQSQREKILDRFRRRKTRILVATDVAARGIDIEGLTHVVNYALPYDGPTYVHRIGRTGRAGAKGLAYTLVRPEERRKLEYIKHFAKKGTKGELIEDQVPSVDEVIAVKKERVFEDLRNKLLGKMIEKAEIEETEEAESAVAAEDSAMNLNSAEESEVFAEDTPDSVSETPDTAEDNAEVQPAREELPRIRRIFRDFAQELCAQKDGEELVARLLQEACGRSLDTSRYGSITTQKSFVNGGGKGRGFGSDNPNQMRIFVQLGRRDGMNARGVAEFFSKLLNIRQNAVDRITVTENFSLVSLPVKDAQRALDYSKKDKKLPHMHQDTKAGDWQDEKPRRERRNNDDRRDFGGERRDRERTFEKRQDRFDHGEGERYDRNDRNDHNDRADRNERPDRKERNDYKDRSDRYDRNDRPDRRNRRDRKSFGDRPSRGYDGKKSTGRDFRGGAHKSSGSANLYKKSDNYDY